MTSTPRLLTDGDAAIIISAYNPAFVEAIKTTFGREARWNPDLKTWTIPAAERDRAKALLLEHFGHDGEDDMVTVRWTVTEDQIAALGPVERYGRVVAEATGRNSGARPGDGVIVEDGVLSSGGSTKNWLTIIRAGSVLIIHDVPRPLAEDDPEAIILSGDAGEVAQLRARLAHLDAERDRIIDRLAALASRP